jgi:hypothetical protein
MTDFGSEGFERWCVVMQDSFKKMGTTASFALIEGKDLPRTERWAAFDAGNRSAGRNPILDWLRESSRLTPQYVRQLMLVDRTLAESLGEAYPSTPGLERLRLALFMEYAAEQHLGPGEVAMLMGGRGNTLDEALNVLLDAAKGMVARRNAIARKLRIVPAMRTRHAR